MVEKYSPQYDDQNIFIKIIRGEINACRVYEDDALIALMDVMPHSPGHVLVIPKCRARDIFEVPQEVLAQIILVIKKIAKACKNAFQADGIQIMQFNGTSAGQTIPHLHFHVIPCKSGDNTLHTNIHPTQKTETLENLDFNAQKIRKELHLYEEKSSLKK
ncbi:histidine triad (HIT) family protein [Candidatus Liberibacter solanacearum]|uniref:HIT family protein n=1 Tax=Candidatus Liberibacter solanacearum TaxID=556287 RepID=UPI0038715D02